MKRLAGAGAVWLGVLPQAAAEQDVAASSAATDGRVPPPRRVITAPKIARPMTNDAVDAFARAIGHEADGMLPPIIALAFATDADNTGSQTLTYFSDISFTAP